MISKSNWRDTLLVTIIIPKGLEQMKSTRTSDFVFLRDLLMLDTCTKEFLMKLEILSLPMGITNILLFYIILSILELSVIISVLCNCVTYDCDRYYIFIMLCDMCDYHV